MKKKLLRYSLLMLMMLVGGASSVWADEVTMKYTGTTTTNMTGDNDAATVNLDASAWSVVGAKGHSNQFPGLNQNGTIRLYWNTEGSNTITVSSLADVTISSITVTYNSEATRNGYVEVDGTKVTGTPSTDNANIVTYDINNSVFVLGNANTTNVQVHIKEIVITYSGGSTPTLDYFVVGSMTGWGTLETFKMSVNPDNSAEYMLTKQFAAGDQIKVEDSNGVYYPDGTGNHYTLTKDGTHTIYFRPDGQGGSDWHYGYIYVDDSQATDPEPQPTEAHYFLIGDFNNWTQGDADYEMTLDATSSKYTITTDLTAGQGIKVIKIEGNETTWYPSGTDNNYVVNVTGTHTIVLVNPDATTGVATDYFTVSDDEAEPQPVLANGFYLVGSFNSWTASADYLLTENAGQAGEYQILLELYAGDELKVVYNDGGNYTWYPASGDNYVVKVTGNHTVYFRPAGNQDWAYYYIYLTDDEAPVGAYNLTSVSDNGTVQFFVNDALVTSANEGATVAFTIEPNEGYVADEAVLVEAYVNFEDAQAPGGQRLSIIRVLEYTETEGVYSFTMPAANARVTVTYSVDKSELEELVEDAEDLLDELPADSEAAEDLQDAIDDANNVLNNPDATAQDVADAIEDLQDAIDAAEEALAGSTIEVNVPAQGFVTMFLEDNSKLMPTREAGVKLYTVASVNVANEEAVLSSELTIVKGKTPFLLYNETSADITAKLIMASGTPDNVTPAAEFQGTLEAKTFTADDLANYDHYVLTGKNFYWAAEPGTIPANRCWIQLAKDAGAPAQLAIVFEGGTTGINATLSDMLNDNVIYDLSGRRVANPTKGLYIMNGRKFVVK